MLTSAPGLHVADYVVFGGMLLISLGIGVYYSLSGGRQRTTDEYLLGNRNMSVLPVTLSFTVSFISTILLLGFPAEIYSFGAEITTGLIGVIIGNLLAVVVFVPVIYPLKMTSVNEVCLYCPFICCLQISTHTKSDSRFAPSQWEAVLLCNNVSHWLGASLKSILHTVFSFVVLSSKAILSSNCKRQRKIITKTTMSW